MTFALLQRKAQTRAGPAETSAPPRAPGGPGAHWHAVAFHPAPGTGGRAVPRGGDALDAGTRERMGARFGEDFSDVRVHTGADAAALAGALRADAYTLGAHVVFGRGRYAPREPAGQRLIAHELAHVVQQRRASPGASSADHPALEREADAASEPSADRVRIDGIAGGAGLIQRQPVTGTTTSINEYDVGLVHDQPQQQRGNTRIGPAQLQLSYDPAASTFTIRFPLAWIFPHAWDDAHRQAYVHDFETQVLRVWNDRFLLVEGGSSRRTAHVHIEFDEVIVPQQANDTLELLQWAGATARWKMDVRNLGVRANVDRGTGVVQLDQDANRPQRRDANALRQNAQFSYSGTGGNRTYTQTTSPHEFGHMLGLGDEYLDDSGTVPSAARGIINSRIMNVGEDVTADVYAPFADWLSGLTHTAWRVGGRAH